MDVESETLDRNAAATVKEIGIPPCPAILSKLLREARASDPDFRRIGQLIGGDVALASAVLKVANSPFYGLRSKAASVQQALTLLGLNTVVQLVTGLLLRDAFAGSCKPGMEAYWKSSMAISLICAMISRETRRRDPGVTGTYGLFRDCGMPVMLQKFAIYSDVFDGSALTPGEPPLELENERYATNHARVGAQLARSWYLPESVCLAILHHHDAAFSDEIIVQADADALVLIATGLAAEQMYCAATGTVSPEWELGFLWALKILDLTQDDFDALGARVRASIKGL